jgi:hypothetical protein
VPSEVWWLCLFHPISFRQVQEYIDEKLLPLHLELEKITHESIARLD